RAQIVKFLEDAATSNIWLPRHIRAKAKHTEFSGDSASFRDASYNGSTCPGAQNDPLVADKELLMERRGGIPFL
ncbi:hypothetical protein BG000_005662, partial [Podila horticola]